MDKNYHKNYYRENKERLLAQQREYYLKNKEYILARNKQYAEDNPEVNKKSSAKYRRTEKGKLIYNAKTRNYRAKKYNAEGSHTGKEFAEIIIIQNKLCYWCNLPHEKLEADHYIPVSKGGANSISNIVAACRACNAKKKDLLPEEFISLTGDSRVVNPNQPR